MIFIRNSGENTFFIPKNGINFDEKRISLSLKSELTLKQYNFTDLEDISIDDYNFYKLVVDFSDVESGEYVYELNDGLYTSRGLMRVGNVQTQPKKDEKSYKKTEEVKEYKY